MQSIKEEISRLPSTPDYRNDREEIDMGSEIE